MQNVISTRGCFVIRHNVVKFRTPPATHASRDTNRLVEQSFELAELNVGSDPIYVPNRIISIVARISRRQTGRYCRQTRPAAKC